MIIPLTSTIIYYKFLLPINVIYTNYIGNILYLSLPTRCEILLSHAADIIYTNNIVAANSLWICTKSRRRHIKHKEKWNFMPS